MNNFIPWKSAFVILALILLRTLTTHSHENKEVIYNVWYVHLHTIYVILYLVLYSSSWFFGSDFSFIHFFSVLLFCITLFYLSYFYIQLFYVYPSHFSLFRVFIFIRHLHFPLLFDFLSSSFFASFSSFLLFFSTSSSHFLLFYVSIYPPSHQRYLFFLSFPSLNWSILFPSHHFLVSLLTFNPFVFDSFDHLHRPHKHQTTVLPSFHLSL